MAKRRARKRPAPTNGRRLKGAWRSDFVDGCRAAESDGELVPLCGVLPGAVIPAEPPQWREQVRHSGSLIVDPDERRFMPNAGEPSRVAIRDKFATAKGRSETELAAYWAKKDGMTLRAYQNMRAISYGEAHKVKRAPLGRSLSFHQGLNRRDQEREETRLRTIQAKALYDALAREIGHDSLESYLAQPGATMAKLAWCLGARAQ